MSSQLIHDRLKLGRERYGHGIIISDDTTKYGTKVNDWRLMAQEEILDCIVYMTADLMRKQGIENDDNNDTLMKCIIKYKETDEIIKKLYEVLEKI